MEATICNLIFWLFLFSCIHCRILSFLCCFSNWEQNIHLLDLFLYLFYPFFTIKHFNFDTYFGLYPKPNLPSVYIFFYLFFHYWHSFSFLLSILWSVFAILLLFFCFSVLYFKLKKRTLVCLKNWYFLYFPKNIFHLSPPLYYSFCLY